MKIEKINENNYINLVLWYDEWNLPITPFSYIPETALIVEDICAGSVYQFGKTPMWWIEGIVSNPKIKDKSIKKEALTLLINALVEMAKQNNAEIILASTPRESLKELFLTMDFNQAPEKYFHLARGV